MGYRLRKIVSEIIACSGRNNNMACDIGIDDMYLQYKRPPTNSEHYIRSCWSSGVHIVCVYRCRILQASVKTFPKRNRAYISTTPGSFDTLGGLTRRTYNPKRNQLNSSKNPTTTLPHIVTWMPKESVASVLHTCGVYRAVYTVVYIPTLGLNQHSSD